MHRLPDELSDTPACRYLSGEPAFVLVVRRSRIAAYLVLIIAMVGVFLAMTIGAVPDPATKGTRSIGALFLIFFLYYVYSGVVSLVGGSTVSFTPTKLVVRNGSGEASVRWGDVDAFSPKFFRGRLLGYAVKTNGRPIRVTETWRWIWSLGRRGRSTLTVPQVGLQGGILLLPLLLWCHDKSNRAQVGSTEGRVRFHRSLRSPGEE